MAAKLWAVGEANGLPVDSVEGYARVVCVEVRSRGNWRTGSSSSSSNSWDGPVECEEDARRCLGAGSSPQYGADMVLGHTGRNVLAARLGCPDREAN